MTEQTKIEEVEVQEVVSETQRDTEKNQPDIVLYQASGFGRKRVGAIWINVSKANPDRHYYSVRIGDLRLVGFDNKKVV